MAAHGYNLDDTTTQEFEQMMAHLLADVERSNFYNFHITEQDTLRGRFLNYDREGNGKLGPPEITILLCSMGYAVSEDQVDDLFKTFDTEKSGRVDAHEFGQMLAFLLGDAKQEVQRQDTLKGRFKRFDADGDGKLTIVEVKAMMESMGYSADEAYLQSLLAKFDLSTVSINLAEYEKMLGFLLGDNVAAVEASAGGTEESKSSKQDTLRARFTRFDSDGDGKLGPVEVDAMMVSMGFSPDREYLDQLMKQFDSDQSGQIELKVRHPPASLTLLHLRSLFTPP